MTRLVLVLAYIGLLVSAATSIAAPPARGGHAVVPFVPVCTHSGQAVAPGASPAPMVRCRVIVERRVPNGSTGLAGSG